MKQKDDSELTTWQQIGFTFAAVMGVCLISEIFGDNKSSRPKTPIKFIFPPTTPTPPTAPKPSKAPDPLLLLRRPPSEPLPKPHSEGQPKPPEETAKETPVSVDWECYVNAHLEEGRKSWKIVFCNSSSNRLHNVELTGQGVEPNGSKSQFFFLNERYISPRERRVMSVPGGLEKMDAIEIVLKCSESLVPLSRSIRIK